MIYRVYFGISYYRIKVITHAGMYEFSIENYRYHHSPEPINFNMSADLRSIS
jgi:hypothetical protein